MCVFLSSRLAIFLTRQAYFHHKHALATTGNIGTYGLTQRESSMLIRQNSHTQNVLTSLKIYRMRVERRELRMCDKGGIFHALAHLSCTVLDLSRDKMIFTHLCSLISAFVNRSLQSLIFKRAIIYDISFVGSAG